MNIILGILFFIFWVGLLVYILVCPTRDEVNCAIRDGVITDRSEKFSKKCRLYIRIKRNKNQIRSIKNDIDACVYEYQKVVDNEKKNN